MTNLILTTPDELRQIVRDEISKALAGAIPVSPSQEQPDGLMTRKAAAAFLSVSVSTIDNYAKQGLLTKVPIGDRGVRFERGEVGKLFDVVKK